MSDSRFVTMVPPSTYRVGSVGHGVEWADRCWELVEDIVVGVVLLPN